MRSLAAEQYGKPDTFKVMDLPKPEIVQPDDVLVKVHAASLNPIDVKLASGMAKMVWPSTMPFRLGYDVSGTVEAVGSAVRPELEPGVEVYARVPERCRGTASDYTLSIADATAVKPATLSHVQAASIPLATLTALQSLDMANKFLDGGLEGKTVYVPGGLSGTGSAAVQLAKNVFKAGRVITSLSTGKITKADELLGKGVLDQVVDYTKEDPGKAIAAASVDFMFDTMNGAMPSLHLMRRGGIIVSVSGVPFGDDMKRKAPHMPVAIRYTLNAVGRFMQFRAGRYGVEYRALGMTESNEDLSRLRGWINQGLLKPIVGRTAKLSDLDSVIAGCAEIYSGKGGIGKFVIEVAEDQ